MRCGSFSMRHYQYCLAPAGHDGLHSCNEMGWTDAQAAPRHVNGEAVCELCWSTADWWANQKQTDITDEYLALHAKEHGLTPEPEDRITQDKREGGVFP